MPLPESSFSYRLIKLNYLQDSFLRWHFPSGMNFGDNNKWWGEKGKRLNSHEGIDLLYFFDKSGELQSLDSRIVFPPLFSGEIVSVFPDFIGVSILFRHTVINSLGFRLYSIFGHTSPLAGIKPGVNVDAKQPVGKIAKSKRPNLFGHLHVSVLWLSPEINEEELDWKVINSSKGVGLVNPIDVLGLL